MGVTVREKKKGSGVFWLFINHQGQRKSKKIGDEKTAKEVAKKVEARLALGEFNIQERSQMPTFKEYAEQWLTTDIKATRRHSTYERYRDILKGHVYPEIGTKRLDEIGRADIRKLLLGLHKNGYSRSTICLVRDVISGPFGCAIDDELLSVNPVQGILKRLKLERSRGAEVSPMTPEEVSLFLGVCKESYPEYHHFFLCAFRTGMRLGELLALEWGDIDWNSKYIMVQRSYKRDRVEKTKTGKARRVDMSDQLAVGLKQLLIARKKEALKDGREAPHRVVFHRNGKHMAQNYIRRIFKRALGKAGLRDMRLHDTRHTFASLLLSNGESPVYVKEQLGHSSIQMTVDIYGHLIPSSNRHAVNKLDDLNPSAPHTHPPQKEKATTL